MSDLSAEVSETSISVFDVPLSATSEDLEMLLNGAVAKGLYVNCIVPWPGVGARVVLRRYAAKAEKVPAVKMEKVEKAIPPTREDNALRFLRDNRTMSATALSAACKALGHPRSPAWVKSKLADIILAERRAL